MSTAHLPEPAHRASDPSCRAMRADVDLDPDNWAYLAITDFTRTFPVTVSPTTLIDEAREQMIAAGVHALLVTDPETEIAECQVVGLVTSYDIQKHQQRIGRSDPSSRHPKSPVYVRDLMTTWDDLPLIHFESLLGLTVRELHERFNGTGLTHFLVVETESREGAAARGLISRAAIARRLWRSTRSP